MRGFVIGRYYIPLRWITAFLCAMLGVGLLVGMWEGYKVAVKVRLLRQQLENLKQEAAVRQMGRNTELVGYIQQLQNETELLKVQIARMENDVQRLRNQAAGVGMVAAASSAPVLAPMFQAKSPAPSAPPAEQTEPPPFRVIRLQFIGEQKLPGHLGLRDAATMALQNQAIVPLAVKVVADRAVTNFVLEPLGLRDDILFRANRNDSVFISSGNFNLELRVP